MQDIVKKDILNVLGKAVKLIHDEDAAGLNQLSNHIIHDASIFQDDDSVSIAILTYAISKIMIRCFEKHEDWEKSCVVLVPQIEDARKALEKGKFDRYRRTIRNLFSQIQNLDKKLKLYIQVVLDKARIKKASKLHAHGISIARTAELLNITQWELQDYVGKTTFPEVRTAISATERLKFARSLFK